MPAQEYFRNLIAMALLALVWTGRLHALDGIAIGVHFQRQGAGSSHDDVTPGKLMRYDLRDGKVVASRGLFERDDVVSVSLSPFGDRIAFSRAGGMIGVVGIDGGKVTELVNLLGEEKADGKEPRLAGLQWPGGDGGKWIYYLDTRRGGARGGLRRVNVDTKREELVAVFNRAIAGEFALSADATRYSGKFIMGTDEDGTAIYDLARGDGDLFNCPRSTGCGESIAPDGSLFTANDGLRTTVSLVDMSGARQQGFRLSQWDGDPCDPARGKTAQQMEWGWGGFRWAVNSMDWIAVTQGKLRAGSRREMQFVDLMLYDWVGKKQINVTHNLAGQFDRAGGFWETGKSELPLGYFSGKAPFTVEIDDSRIRGEAVWDFGDGSSPARGRVGKHVYVEEGVYALVAKEVSAIFRGQVTVQKRRAPRATAHYVNETCLAIEFDEPVRAHDVQVRLESGIKTAAVQIGEWGAGKVWGAGVQPFTPAPPAPPGLSPEYRGEGEEGRRMVVRLASPLRHGERLRITGVSDVAQLPSALEDKAMEVEVPAWPSDRKDLVYVWQDGTSYNAVYDSDLPGVRELRVSQEAGIAGLDRYGRMRLEGGRLRTGFFSRADVQMEFRQTVLADAFTLEATIQSMDLKQSKPLFPARIINCGAGDDGDWEFVLGQQEDRLMFSIRTSENMLTLDGKPTRGDLHGRAPLYEITRLPDTKPHHVIVTFMPGELAGYVDGKRVFLSGAVKGSLKACGHGELCFGDNHNGGRYGWLGKLEGVALYKRALPADEVRKNYQAYATVLKSRKVLPQIEVEARLVAMSTIPDRKRIAPYHDALMVNEYKVISTVGMSDDWPLKGQIQTGGRIRVAQWGLIDDHATVLTRAKLSDVRRLVLEAYDKHPDKIEEVATSNTLDIDVDVPMLYEPR